MGRVFVFGDEIDEYILVRDQGARPGRLSWQDQPPGKVYTKPGGVHPLKELIEAFGVTVELEPNPELTRGAPQASSIWKLEDPPRRSEWTTVSEKRYFLESSLLVSTADGGYSASLQAKLNAYLNADWEPSDVLILNAQGFALHNLDFSQLDGFTGTIVFRLQDVRDDFRLINTNVAKLLAKHSERVVLITSDTCLRSDDLPISRGLSWERTLQDILATRGRENEESLRLMCKWLVVSFARCGAFLRARPHISGFVRKLNQLDLNSDPWSDEQRLNTFLNNHWKPYLERCDDYRAVRRVAVDQGLGFRCRLIYRPSEVDPSLVEPRRNVYGLSTIMSAAIVAAVVNSAGGTDQQVLIDGIKQGLVSISRLYELGFGVQDEWQWPVQQLALAKTREDDLKLDEQWNDLHVPGNLIFALNHRRITEAAPGAHNQSHFDRGYYRLLGLTIGASPNAETRLFGLLREDFLHDAKVIVKTGYSVLKRKAPYYEIVDEERGRTRLISFDRRECEDLRSLGEAIHSYKNYVSTMNARFVRVRPLNIMVFGPPGSGKTTGIRLVAGKVLEKHRVAQREFNMTSMRDEKDLSEALNEVRDLTVEGKIPLVIWDEFDVAVSGRRFGWLPRFIGPMEDGRYLDQRVEHPLGGCIFAFIGSQFESVAAALDAARSNSADPVAVELRKEKGRDFMSRVACTYEPGAFNPGRVSLLLLSGAPFVRPGSEMVEDYMYLLRRAIILRQLLTDKYPGLLSGNDLHVSDRVIEGFLCVPKYYHASRSMERILSACTLHGKSRFERADLPSETILNLHVDGAEFLRITREGP